MAIRRSKNTGTATGGDGSDFAANACGTINECSTTAEETRCLASVDTTMAGVTVAYAKGTAATPNRYLTFNAGNLSSYAALIDICEAGWALGAATDVAVTYTTGVIKNGTANKLTLTFDASPKTTTLQAYKVVANLSLAAFQNICTWVVATAGTLPANSLVIKLFTGNDGVTGEVASINLAEAQSALSANNALTLNNGGALPNGVNSIAIYTGAVAPAASSVWKFDTFYATVAGFDLNSVLHKPYNYRGVAWAATTAIALNEIRVPTFAARTPLVYKCVQAGTTGATEYFTDANGESKPIWDKAYLPVMGDFAAQRVTDGTVIWECQGDDEAFYFWTIKSLDVAGNRIEIDNHCANVGNAGRGYYGTDETAGLSYSTPYLYPMPTAAATMMDSVGASGTNAVPREISGGWTSPGGVDTVTGVTFISARNGLGYVLQLSNKNAVSISGIGIIRGGRCFDVGLSTASNWISLRCLFGIAFTAYGHYIVSSYPAILIAKHLFGFSGAAVNTMFFTQCIFRDSFSIKAISGLGATAAASGLKFNNCGGVIGDISGDNCAGYGISTGGACVVNSHTSLNAVGSIVVADSPISKHLRHSASEATILGTISATLSTGTPVFIQNFGGVIGDNRAYYGNQGQATYNSATHVWTLAVNSVQATARVPMRHKVGSIRCDTAGVPYTISLDVNPANANLVAQLKVLGNTIAGVQYDTYAQSAGAGLQTLTVTITPLEAGTVEVCLDCYLTDLILTYTLVYDLDSLAATKNAAALRIYWIGDQMFGDELVKADTDATFPAAANVDPLAAVYGWAGEYTPAMDVPALTSIAEDDTLRGVAGSIPLADIVTPRGTFDEAARNTITPDHVENLFNYIALGVPEIGGLGSASSQSSRSQSSYSQSSYSDSVSSSSDSNSSSMSSDSSDSSSSLELETGECIQAQITAKLKTLLGLIKAAHGYQYDVAAVEQARKVLEINDRWEFILLCENEPDVEDDLIIRTLEYPVWFFSKQDDELIGDPAQDKDSEIAYHNRNAVADITKAINTDIYLGGLAENVEVGPGTHDLYVDENTTLFGTWCVIKVTTSIDATNPYKLR